MPLTLPLLLVIDDDDLIAEMVRYALTPLLSTIRIHVSPDIDDALGKLSPTLIISDLRLTATKGEATLIRLREVFPTQVIVPMSGVAPSEMDTWQQRYQLAPFLSKDHLLTGLLSVVEARMLG